MPSFAGRKFPHESRRAVVLPVAGRDDRGSAHVALVSTVAVLVVGLGLFFGFRILSPEAHDGPIDGDAKSFEAFQRTFPSGCEALVGGETMTAGGSNTMACKGSDFGIGAIDGMLWYQWDEDGSQEHSLELAGSEGPSWRADERPSRM